jgi:hypothetical protein
MDEEIRLPCRRPNKQSITNQEFGFRTEAFGLGGLCRYWGKVAGMHPWGCGEAKGGVPALLQSTI